LPRFLALTAAATASLALLGATDAIADPAVPAGAIVLDTHEGGNTGAAGPVRGPSALTAGSWYVVKVQGTFAAWTNWPSRRCGKVEPAPMWRSEGVTDAPVGDDAEFRFAQPNLRKADCPSGQLPRRTGVFQILTDTAARWSHPAPIGGVPAKPTANHTYRYAVQGNGIAPRFRLKDWHTGDNNGRLMITVRAAKAADCGDGGFASFGFADEVTCQSALS
jgi:hypothetical protein